MKLHLQVRISTDPEGFVHYLHAHLREAVAEEDLFATTPVWTRNVEVLTSESPVPQLRYLIDGALKAMEKRGWQNQPF